LVKVPAGRGSEEDGAELVVYGVENITPIDILKGVSICKNVIGPINLRATSYG
jgi:hypothetical protein